MRFDAKITAVLSLGVFTFAPLSGPSAPSVAAATTQTTPAVVAQKPADPQPEQKPAEAAPQPQPKTVTVQSGDNLSTIATANNTTWVRIFDANSQIADPNLINPGDQLIIPGADQQLPDRYSQLAPAQVATMPAITATAAPLPAVVQHATAGGANSYVWGTCTWYVKNRRPDIGSFWGNAGYGWISEAAAAGFATGFVPAPGAVAVTAGHVAYVESVSGGMVNISEMNYAGGIGQVHYRTVPVGSFQYIY